MPSSIGDIRIRLFLLLGRAFVIVLGLSVVFFLVGVSYFLTAPPNRLIMPSVSYLEGYYLGHGSWEGVETVFQGMEQLGPPNWILLDLDGRILIDHRPGSQSTAGAIYRIQPGDGAFEMTAHGKKMGTFVIPSFTIPTRLLSVRDVLVPVGTLSSILALFLIVVAVLLLRRFVNPLADVIYAARAVAKGKLGTRISTKGQGDIRGLSESFNEMALTLERSDRERRDMLADIAHELRTPLSIIRGRLEGIVDGIYSANGSQVSLALEQSYLLERLVDDLRVLTLAETRQLHFEKRTVDLSQLAQKAIDLFSAESREKNISLALGKADGDLHAEVDPQRIEQVIGNLINNALRYIPEGGKIWITLEQTAEGVCLSVNDNGPGVAIEDLPYLFDRFWRKDKSRSRVSGGTGLGLAIARQLIEAQGGTIAARNLPEGGLQVEIRFEKNPS
jgi:signal transduction histidine kinase